MPEESSGSRAAATVRLPVAVVVVLAAVVVALLAVWGTTVVDAARLPTGPALDPPAPPPQATVLTIDDQRHVRFQEFAVTLADLPYICQDDVEASPPAFTSFVACSAVVHANYGGSGHDWVATTGAALLDDAVARSDPEAAAEAAFAALVTQSFSADDHPKVVERKGAQAQIPAPAGSAATYEAKVKVSRKGLPTPYDKVVVIVVKLQSGRYAMFFSDFPHDGSKAALDAVIASVGTVTART